MIFVVNRISVENCLPVLCLVATIYKLELYKSTSQTCIETENIILTPFKEGKLPKRAKCYMSASVKLVYFVVGCRVPNVICRDSCTCQSLPEDYFHFLDFCFEKT